MARRSGIAPTLSLPPLPVGRVHPCPLLRGEVPAPASLFSGSRARGGRRWDWLARQEDTGPSFQDGAILSLHISDEVATPRRALPSARARVPTTFVQKYTPRAQDQALGCPRAGLRARETGGGGRPARFCQEQMHVLAEQFSSMEHDAFRVSVSVRQNARSRIQWTGRRARRSTTLRIERLHRGTPDGSTEADERPPARRPPGRQGTLAARSVAGCSPRSSAT